MSAEPRPTRPAATRLAVLSDIHGNLPALEAVVDHARRQGCTGFVNLGDIVSGPLWPRETVDFLRRFDWPTLAGNHERQLLTQLPPRLGASDAFAAAELRDDQRAWLAALPATAWLDGQILLCHGTPHSDVTYWLESFDAGFGIGGSLGLRPAQRAEVQQRLGAPDPAGRRATLALCGHSHLPRAAQLDGGLLVVNPGSVGLQAYDDAHGQVHWVENGSPHARYAVVEPAGAGGSQGVGQAVGQAVGQTAWQVAWHAVAYDWAAAAARAEANSRPDWADALRTGRVGRTEDPRG